MKKDRAFYGWLFTCVTLAILLGFSIYLGATGWYFKAENSEETEIRLGETCEVQIFKNQASSVSLSFSGSYLPEEKLAQIIAVKNLEDEKEIYVRAKIEVFTNDGLNHDISLIETANWQLNQNDGYYYFLGALIPSEKTSLCSHIVIGKDSEFLSSKKYIMSVIFESLGERADAERLWGFLPIENI